MNSQLLVRTAAALLLAGNIAMAQGTAFTYQGRLSDAAGAAQGSYDLVFSLWPSSSDGAAIGAAVTNQAVTVSNGLFSARLDFGGNAFNGSDRWLEIAVRTNGAASFTTLSPRQPLTAAPHSLFSHMAGSVLNGDVRNPAFIGTTTEAPLEFFAGNTRALRLEPNTNQAPNVIGGSPVNSVDPGKIGATIAGGGVANSSGFSIPNRIAADFGTIGGGVGNFTEGTWSVIAGGYGNRILSNALGGVIAGGNGNTIMEEALLSSITGGSGNTLEYMATWAHVGGGYNNRIASNTFASSVVGGLANLLGPGASTSVIVGGSYNTNLSPSSVVSGGNNNMIDVAANLSVISGGWLNFIHAGADQSVIAGGNGNQIYDGARESMIGGGFANAIQTNALVSFIGGGAGNRIDHSSAFSTIGAGQDNVISSNSPFASITGGNANFAGARGTTVAGGENNMISSNSVAATISGGQGNVIGTNASFAMIPGGQNNRVAGDFSLAAGRGARANHRGTFVWADSQAAAFNSTASNQFIVRAAGGVGIGTSNPTSALEVAGTVKAGAFQASGSGFSGTFVGNGTGITNVNATFLGGYLSSNYWRSGGNDGLATPTLGTLDDKPLDLIANAERMFHGRAARRNVGLFSSLQAPNIAGGSWANTIVQGVIGGTIAGGGMTEHGLASYVPHPNVVSDDFGTVGGGRNNIAGNTNSDPADVIAATVSGGDGNRVQASHGTIGGGGNNLVSGVNATVGGGVNQVAQGVSAAIAGGSDNYAMAMNAAIGGGQANTVSGAHATVAGGQANTASADFSSVSGGTGNGAAGMHGAVGGGSGNVAGGSHATVPGGRQNIAAGNSSFAAGTMAIAAHPGAFVWADQQLVPFTSSAENQFIVRATGGVGINTAQPGAMLQVGDVGTPNSQGVIRLASRSGTGAETRHWDIGVPEGDSDVSGKFYSFVIDDPLTGADPELTIRWGSGNVGIGTTEPSSRLHSVAQVGNGVQGSSSDVGASGVYGENLTGAGYGVAGRAVGAGNAVFGENPNASGWAGFFIGNVRVTGTINPPSDRNVKTNFAPIDGVAVLEKLAALPMQSWSYTNSPAIRHVGPVAQEFHAAFGLGSDDKSIATVDADGIAMAAIQGLNRKLEETRETNAREIAARDARIAALERSIARMESVIRAFEAASVQQP